MNLTDLLQFLAAGRKSGTLRFDRGNVSKQVYFKNGLIVGSKSNDPREYLGQVKISLDGIPTQEPTLAPAVGSGRGA